MEDAFRNREAGFEAKFASDQEVKFKIEIHRNKLFSAWAADQMGDQAPPDYADALLEFAFGRDPEDLIEKVKQDLRDHGVAAADKKVGRAFDLCAESARDEVMTGKVSAAVPLAH